MSEHECTRCMPSPPRNAWHTPLLVVIAALLAANLMIQRQPAQAPLQIEMLPRAEANQPLLEAELRTGKTIITTSPDGSTLFVWYCRIVNGFPTFEGHRYATGQ
jgi:hypothetical protein